MKQLETDTTKINWSRSTNHHLQQKQTEQQLRRKEIVRRESAKQNSKSRNPQSSNGKIGRACHGGRGTRGTIIDTVSNKDLSFPSHSIPSHSNPFKFSQKKRSQ